MCSTSSERRSLLVVGHPGHELRVHRWVKRAAPVVCILTDGSGRDSAPRLCESLDLLQGLGAHVGPLCGEFSDRQVYVHILDQNYDFFVALCERLTEVIVAQGIDMVVSDAMEGYNPTHDLCEVLARSAVTLANQQKSQHTRHYAFPLIGDPRPSRETDPSTYLEIELSASQLQQKLEAAREYARRGGGALLREVEETLGRFGEQAFSREYLFAAAPPGRGPEQRFEDAKPFYESHGEAQVAAGRYVSVIRFREHIAPLIVRLDAMGMVAGQAGAGHFHARSHHQ